MSTLDLYLPDGDGLSSVKLFHASYPDVPIVVVSGTDLHDDIKELMHSGARGFIPKMMRGEEMIHALRPVPEGGIYWPPQLFVH